jgi:hypothetical protein
MVLVDVIFIDDEVCICPGWTSALPARGTPPWYCRTMASGSPAAFGRPRPATEVPFDRFCRERHHSPPHQRTLAHHHGEDRAVPPVPAGRVARRPSAVRRPGRRAGDDRRLAGRLQHRPTAPVAGHGRPGVPVPTSAGGRAAAATARRSCPGHRANLLVGTRSGQPPVASGA